MPLSSAKIRDMTAQVMLAVLALTVAWYMVAKGSVTTAWAGGFFLGMMGGFTSAALLHARKRKRKRSLGTFALLSSPIVIMPVLPFSTAFGIGYIPGFAFTFLFSSALIDWVEHG